MKCILFIVQHDRVLDKAREVFGCTDRVTQRFVSVRCVNPAHNDQVPSAGIKIDLERGRLYYKCHKCDDNQTDIIKSTLIDRFGGCLSLSKNHQTNSSPLCTLSDLFPDIFHDEIRSLGIIERRLHGSSCVSFPLYIGDQVVGYHNRIRKNGSDKWRCDHGVQLSRGLFYAIRPDSAYVFLCESPVDAVTFYLMGYSSVACCGKNNVSAFSTIDKRRFANKRFVIWVEPDASDFASQICSMLSLQFFVIHGSDALEKDAWRIAEQLKWNKTKTRKEINKLLGRAYVQFGTDLITPDAVLIYKTLERVRNELKKLSFGIYWFSGRAWVDAAVFEGEVRNLIFSTISKLAYEYIGTSLETAARKFLSINNFNKVVNVVLKALPLENRNIDSSDCEESKYLLSVRNGIIDLRTGTLLPHDPKYPLVESLDVEYREDAKSELWDKFINEIFPDKDVRRYAQVILGSCLTGVNSRSIYVFYGSGANGKSTLLLILQNLLKSYLTSLSRQLVVHGSDDRSHDVKYKPLIHARVAVCDDLGGQSINPDVLKSLSGSGVQITRELFKSNFINFVPRCKIILSTNIPLSFSEQSKAIADRIQYVPFLASIPKENQDPNLAWKLLNESEAILKWLVDGAREFLSSDSIQTPEIIIKTTNRLLSETDPLMDFIEDRCYVNSEKRVRFRDLYNAFVNWCLENGWRESDIWSERRFSRSLSSKGFDTIKSGSVRYKKGLDLKDPENSPDNPPSDPPSNPPPDLPSNPPPDLPSDPLSDLPSDPPSNPPSDPPSDPPLDLPPDSPSDQNPTPQQQDPDEEPPFDVPETIAFDPDKAKLCSVDEVFTQLELVADFAIDLETTGLDPHTDRIRLVSIACKDLLGIRSFVLEWSDEVKDRLAAILSQPELTLVGFNLVFDLAFLQTHGVKAKCKLFDVMLACEVYHGRPHISLEEAAREHLNIQIDKTLQKTDWAGTLTPEMIHYAATDAEVTYKLFEKFRGLLSSDVNLAQVVMLENLALPAIVEMSVSGIRIDIDGWKRLTDELEIKRKAIEQQLINIASSYGFTSINPNSVPQVRALLQKAGINVESTSTDILKTIKHPIASLICEYREIQKLCSAYGHDWLARCKGGVCYPRWHQIGSETGRMSCSDPNLQQIPRSTGHRRLIIPRPGHAFVIADYSQIELRLMAEIANDEAMIAAFRNGQDLHRLTASIILDKPQSNITPEERQLAKAINFGLVYGMSAKSLQNYVYSSYGVSISYEQAEQYRRKFLSYYRGVKRFHDYMASKFNRGDKVVTTRLGRRRTCTTLTQMINTPIQGSGADGLKLALAALSKIKNEDIKIVLAVHDEIVIEAPEDQVEKAKELLIKAMKKGMSAILQKVPCEVEAHVARCWEK